MFFYSVSACRDALRVPLAATLCLAAALGAAPAVHAQAAATLPPRLQTLPVRFNLNNLLTAEGSRWRVELVSSTDTRALEFQHYLLNLAALAVPAEPGMARDYFQINLIDSAGPVRQYGLFIAATQERCINTVRRPGPPVPLPPVTSQLPLSIATGRILEIYHLTGLRNGPGPVQRSPTLRLCSNDRGALTLDIPPPGAEAFRIKVISQTRDERDNETFEYLVPVTR